MKPNTAKKRIHAEIIVRALPTNDYEWEAYYLILSSPQWEKETDTYNFNALRLDQYKLVKINSNQILHKVGKISASIDRGIFLRLNNHKLLDDD